MKYTNWFTQNDIPESLTYYELIEKQQKEIRKMKFEYRFSIILICILLLVIILYIK